MNFGRGISPNGKVWVFVDRLMEEFGRREDGTVSKILQDTRFENHSKATVSGIVVVGTKYGGHEILGDKDSIMPRSNYWPSGYELTSLFKPKINPGDRVWFHYLCVERKEMIQACATGGFYIGMDSNDVFCSLPEDKRSNGLLWNHSYCAAEPIIEDDRVEVFTADGASRKGRIHPSQGVELIIGFNAPPMVDEARLWGMSPSQHMDASTEVAIGDRVYLVKDCEFVNYIMDHKVWVFKHQDIIGIVKSDPEKTVPVGDYHLVKVSMDDYKTTFRRKLVRDELTGYDATLVSRKPILITPWTGEVLASGKRCQNKIVGQGVIFTKRWCKMLNRTHWLVHDGEIQAITDGQKAQD